MADKLLKGSKILSNARKYCTPPSQLPALGEVYKTLLSNKEKMVIMDNGYPFSYAGICFRAGPRFETPENQGISSYIRTLCGLKTENITAFMHDRRLQQLGLNLTVTSGREHICYAIHGVLRGKEELAWAHLSDIATKPLYKDWEIKHMYGKVALENKLASPAAKCLDMVHSAAYRGRTLGRPLLTPEYQYWDSHDHFLPPVLNNFSAEEYHNYITEYHTVDRMGLVGLHVTPAIFTTAREVENGALTIMEYSRPIESSEYKGNHQIRAEDMTPEGHIMVVGKGATLASGEEINLKVAECVLLGQAASDELCSSASSPAGKAFREAGGVGDIMPINIAYSDSGLFGYYLKAQEENQEAAMRAVHDVFMKCPVTDENLAVAKEQAKQKLLEEFSISENYFDFLARTSVLEDCKYTSLDSILEAIDKTTVSSVQNALDSVRSSKLSMGCYGNIDNIPYLDEL